MVGHEQSVHDIQELTMFGQCCRLSNHLNPHRYPQDNSSGPRGFWDSDTSSTYQNERHRKSLVGCSCYCGCHIRGTLPLVCYCKFIISLRIGTALIHDSTTSYQKISLRYRSKTNSSSGCSASRSLASSPLSCLTPFPIL
jgi:hypothetical protein